MKKYFLVLFSLALFAAGNPPEPELWGLFAKTKFMEKLNRELSMYFLYPTFPDELKALEGTEVTLTGFYIPLEITDTHMIILSKFPMAECFFCGGSGPESVAVAYLRDKPRKKLKVDGIIQVHGKLVLNEHDVDELNFIITDATIISYEE